MTSPKETYFFCEQDFPRLRQHQGITDLGAYRRALDRASSPSAGAIGEGTTLYLCSRPSLEALVEFSPQVRLVVLVRPPAELAESFHAQMQVSGFDRRDFREAWSAADEDAQREPAPDPTLLDYRRIAAVGSQLRDLCSWFPAERVFVLTLQELTSESERSLRSLHSFLGVPPPSALGVGYENPRRGRRPFLTATIQTRTARAATRVARDHLPRSVFERARRARDRFAFAEPTSQSDPSIKESVKAEMAAEEALLAEILRSGPQRVEQAEDGAPGARPPI